MKKYVRILLFTILAFIIFNFNKADASSLKIKYNNKTYNYKGRQITCKLDNKNLKMNSTKGLIIKNTVMVSYKDIIKTGMGISCKYDSSTRKLTINGNGKTILLTLNSKTAYVNNKKTKLTQAPLNVRYVKKKKTKLLVPIKFIAGTLGYTYSYNKSSSLVTFTSPYVIKYNSDWHIYKKYKGSVIYNDSEIKLNSMPLMSINGCTMGPAKTIFQSNLGYTYTYNKEEGTVTLASAEHKLVMSMNSTIAVLDDIANIELKSSPLVVTRKDTGYSCVMIPIAAAANAFGLNYKWNSSNYTAIIYKTEYLNINAKESYYDNALYTNGLIGIKAVYDPAIKNFVFTMSFTNVLDVNNVILTQDDNSKLLNLNLVSTSNMLGDGTSQVNYFKLSTVDYIQGADNNTYIMFHYTDKVNYYYSVSGNELKLIFAQNPINGYEINIPLPDGVDYKSIQTDDRYYENAFIVSIPGNYSTYYSSNNLTIMSTLISNYSVTYNSSTNYTDISFFTEGTDIVGFKLYHTDNSVSIKVGAPKDVYDNIVILDPGHGGKDPGAIENKTNECDINYAILYTKAKKYFNSADSSIKAYWTRVDNTFITLAERAEFASKMKAQLFVSLHMNSSNTSAKGTEIYYCSTNNSANDFGLTSKGLASKLMSAIVPAVGTSKREVKSANYYVLKHNTVPAVLIELGFMTNSTDFNIITNPVKQDAAAKAIYDALTNLFSE